MQLQLRCLQLDLARQKETLEFIKSYVDFAKEHGYNAVLLYLENAVRTPDTAFFNPDNTYSMEEMKEVVEYANAQEMMLIPAFENLGHLEKFFAYPQLQHIAECEHAETEGRGILRGYGNVGCTQKPEFYQFIDKYITDVASLFDAPYIHMGLDEPFDFAVCPRCRAEMQKGKTKADLFYEHVMHTYALVAGMGKRMMMWDDFFEYADIAKRLPRDIIFCNWNYYFITDESAGHWTNRIKRDWFAYYEKLGFSYMFCPYANSSGATYNVDTFTAYASKYNPIGALMTSWEHADTMYEATYLSAAYAGEKWSGKIQTQEDAKALYERLIGDTEAAELLLSFQAPVFYGGYKNAAVVCENDSLLKCNLRAQLGYLVQKLKPRLLLVDGKQKDILTDVYNHLSAMLQGLRLEYLAVETFDNYETGAKEKEYFIQTLEDIAQTYREIERQETLLWDKYRKGIKSNANRFGNKFIGIENMLSALKENAENEAKRGVLYLDMMMHDAFGTPRTELYIKYEGEEEKLLYKGGIKPTTTAWELTGCYTLRFATENKKIEYIKHVHYGEAAVYPRNYRYTVNGKKYVCSSAERVCGDVQDIDNLLYNDARFAKLGNDDGVAHFNDVDLGKIRHTIKIQFQPL